MLDTLTAKEITILASVAFFILLAFAFVVRAIFQVEENLKVKKETLKTLKSIESALAKEKDLV